MIACLENEKDTVFLLKLHMDQLSVASVGLVFMAFSREDLCCVQRVNHASPAVLQLILLKSPESNFSTVVS